METKKRSYKVKGNISNSKINKKVYYKNLRTRNNIKRERIAAKVLDRKEKSLALKERRENYSFGVRILFVILMVFIVAMVVRGLDGTQSLPTLSGFLEMLKAQESFTFSMNFESVDINGFLVGDWGLLDGFRVGLYEILGVLEVVINFILFICKGLSNALVYIIEIIKWLFAGAI